jgi:hypothetical protein
MPGCGGGWLQQNNLPVYVGGAEANVATAAAFRKLFIASDATNETVAEIAGFLREKELVN